MGVLESAGIPDTFSHEQDKSGEDILKNSLQSTSGVLFLSVIVT